MGFWDEAECEALYQVPIEELALTVVSINAIKRTGIISIGDCIDHFLRVESGFFGHVSGRFLTAMIEVEAQMKALGFWVYVERCRQRDYLWTDTIYATKDCF